MSQVLDVSLHASPRARRAAAAVPAIEPAELLAELEAALSEPGAAVSVVVIKQGVAELTRDGTINLTPDGTATDPEITVRTLRAPGN